MGVDVDVEEVDDGMGGRDEWDGMGMGMGVAVERTPYK